MREYFAAAQRFYEQEVRALIALFARKDGNSCNRGHNRRHDAEIGITKLEKPAEREHALHMHTEQRRKRRRQVCKRLLDGGFAVHKRAVKHRDKQQKPADNTDRPVDKAPQLRFAFIGKDVQVLLASAPSA
ncbi:hypothetical protein SDC9_75138 [bioreactor metagenome]|uniref:Uncharacterized protein n=1 Tax=bioreactor metagenome TaxID=1076179 RepID=A0A644YJ03_9ZZZZ